MRPTWIVLVLAAVFSLAGGVGLVRSASPDATPRPAPVVQEVQVGSNADIARVIEGLERDLERLPDDHRGWAQLALAYVEQTRLTGDLTSYDRAGEAIARSYAIEPDQNFSALTADAALAAGRHQFRRALRLSEAALRINEYETAALAIRVDALTELGRYREQMAALRSADRLQPGLAVTVRYAYARELRGQLPRAARLLRRAASSAGPADRGFLLALHADLQRRMGNLAAAEESLEQSEAAVPDYLEAGVSRARLDLARGRLAAGLRGWEEAVRRAPDVDHLIELGELYLFLGREPEARRQFTRAEATLADLLAAGQNEELELAILAADHGAPETALAAARTEWNRRHSVHVADALAWALYRNGRLSEALRRARFATSLGTAEPLPWIHRGSIEAALGMGTVARRHLERGLALDPGLSPWQRAQAEATLDQLPEPGTRQASIASASTS